MQRSTSPTTAFSVFCFLLTISSSVALPALSYWTAAESPNKRYMPTGQRMLHAVFGLDSPDVMVLNDLPAKTRLHFSPVERYLTLGSGMLASGGKRGVALVQDEDMTGLTGVYSSSPEVVQVLKGGLNYEKRRSHPKYDLGSVLGMSIGKRGPPNDDPLLLLEPIGKRQDSLTNLGPLGKRTRPPLVLIKSFGKRYRFFGGQPSKDKVEMVNELFRGVSLGKRPGVLLTPAEQQALHNYKALWKGRFAKKFYVPRYVDLAMASNARNRDKRHDALLTPAEEQALQSYMARLRGRFAKKFYMPRKIELMMASKARDPDKRHDVLLTSGDAQAAMHNHIALLKGRFVKKNGADEQVENIRQPNVKTRVFVASDDDDLARALQRMRQFSVIHMFGKRAAEESPGLGDRWSDNEPLIFFGKRQANRDLFWRIRQVYGPYQQLYRRVTAAKRGFFSVPFDRMLEFNESGEQIFTK